MAKFVNIFAIAMVMGQAFTVNGMNQQPPTTLIILPNNGTTMHSKIFNTISIQSSFKTNFTIKQEIGTAIQKTKTNRPQDRIILYTAQTDVPCLLDYAVDNSTGIDTLLLENPIYDSNLIPDLVKKIPQNMQVIIYADNPDSLTTSKDLYAALSSQNRRQPLGSHNTYFLDDTNNTNNKDDVNLILAGNGKKFQPLLAEDRRYYGYLTLKILCGCGALIYLLYKMGRLDGLLDHIQSLRQ